MKNKRPFLTSIGFLVIAMVLVLLINMRGSVKVVEKRLDQLPWQIGQWSGQDLPMEQRILDELDTDVYINRIYLLEDSDPIKIKLYIGYYGTEKGGRSTHTPYTCFPSQGWGIIENSQIPIKVTLDGQDEKVINVNRMMTKLSDKIELVYHWYQSSGNDVLSSGIEQNIDRFWRRLLLNRNDGAYMQILSPVTQDIKTTDKYLQEFIQFLFPMADRYWPIEKEKEVEKP